MTNSNKKLVIVSNRLPVAIYNEKEQWHIKSSPGGLVTALAPVLRKSGGLWLGWPGCPPEAPIDSLLEQIAQQENYNLKAVSITQDEIEKYYQGFSNRSIWPLFHDLLGHFSVKTENWNSYVDVNRKFAQIVANSIIEDSFVWIHDYQLLLVGHLLREMGITHQLSFFLHIPFPSPDLLRRMPWKTEIIEALLAYDHIGFQTAQDRRNFIQCVKWYKPEVQRVSLKRRSILKYNGREIIVGYYPISIDFDEFNNGAQTPEVSEASWYLHENFPQQTIVLGLDRLDYTKGIPERFLAFEQMLTKYPDTHGKMSLLQIVIPSRTDVTEYKNLKQELDSIAGRINSKFSNQGWMPIHYQFGELNRTQLLGHYRASEIALITPLRDGMNLVAKEYCAASVDNHGTLVLSEFAGAAQQLHKGALLVNPYDLEGTADAIYFAYSMNKEERASRMKKMRSEVRRYNVARWVRWFLGFEQSPGFSNKKEDNQTVS